MTVFDADLFAVVTVERFEAVIPTHSRKALEPIDMRTRIGFAYCELVVEVLQSVPGEDEVVHRIRIVLGAGDPGALEKLAHEPGLHPLLWAAHEEARF